MTLNPICWFKGHLWMGGHPRVMACGRRGCGAEIYSNDPGWREANRQTRERVMKARAKQAAK